MIYFDNAATTLQKPREVREAVGYAMRRYASPGRGGYAAALGAAKAVYDCRETAARLFGCDSDQVVFTSSATHGLNIAIRSLVPPGGRAVISGFEHNSVTRPLAALGAEVLVAGRRLFDPEDTLAAFDAAIGPGVDAVICTHVSNVFGYVLPVEGIARLCAARGVPFVLDAAQSAGCLPISARSLRAAFVAMPGHKGLLGPQGTGLLIVRHEASPIMAGGTGSVSELADMPDFLPDRLEAGTLNVPGICGLHAGLRHIIARSQAKVDAHERALTRLLAEELGGVPGVRCFAAENAALQTGVMSLEFEHVDCETAAANLARCGFAVRAGLHCAPTAHSSAGTLARGTVRFSAGERNTERQTRRFAAAVRRIAGQN